MIRHYDHGKSSYSKLIFSIDMTCVPYSTIGYKTFHPTLAVTGIILLLIGPIGSIIRVATFNDWPFSDTCCHSSSIALPNNHLLNSLS